MAIAIPYKVRAQNLEVFMFIYPERLQLFLDNRGWSAERFAEEIDVDPKKVKSMLQGKPMDVHTARKFLNYFRIVVALSMIDFEKTKVDRFI